MTTLDTPALETFTLAIVVFFVGVGLNRLIPPLGRWNIPEAVTGGLVASLATLAAHEASASRSTSTSTPATRCCCSSSPASGSTRGSTTSSPAGGRSSPCWR